jgi:FkbM family methyltransferase
MAITGKQPSGVEIMSSQLLEKLQTAKGNQNWDGVSDILKTYKEHVGEDPHYLAYASDLAFQNRDMDKVKDCNAKILKLYPNDYWSHYRLGDAALSMGDIDEAYDHFSAAIEANAAAPHAIERRAKILVSRGELDRAVSELKSSILQNPDHTWSVMRLVEIKNALGEYDEALRIIAENRNATGNFAEPNLLTLEAEINRNAAFEATIKQNFDAINAIMGGTTITDVGAADGLFWKFTIMARLGIINGVGFEPDAFEVGTLNTLYPYVKFIPIAIGAKKGKAKFRMAENMPCSSLREPDMDVLGRFPIRSCFATKQVFDINVDTLKAGLKSAGITHIDFLKVDVQGAENDILKGAGSLLKSILAIELETHILPLYKGEHVLWKLIDTLSGYDFRVRGLAPQGSFEGEVVEVEAFFGKDFSELSDKQIQQIFIWEAISDCPQLPFMADDKGLGRYPHLAKTVSERDTHLADLRVMTRALLGL